ncbi:class I SAM-dependent DNA methyltransferase [Aliicoccus persicus]|uniref:Class I SAM-dependent methyltransferase n=1 Tax=Aliicoccus persicus TaxID=930138 RepID=A0A662Z4Q9_9STAP|nr:class I SAM-dependent methyltransferase [Aliicoccus persicus]SEV85353.1 Methyltransferase domain-containing protein [Aliicoccus persicus]HJE18946.1 class I SAM-dependent methyltransferase [Aliicoccus persicus]
MTNHFASMYDALTYDVPDNLWVDIISPYLEHKHSVLDIGCGTGRILSALDIEEKFGFDASREMISIAKENDSSLQLSVQNMQSFDYDRTFDVITANSDVINYLDDLNEVSMFIERVSKHLDPGGVFIFDSHSMYKMMTEFNDQTYADDLETISYIWFAHRGESPYSVDHELIFFNQAENGTYVKTTESFSQRTYPHEDIVNMIKESTLELIHTFSDFDSSNKVTTECERIFYILQKS